MDDEIYIIKPRASLTYKSGCYSSEYEQRKRDVYKWANTISMKVGSEIDTGRPGTKAKVTCLLPGISQIVLLELVLRYRDVGWDVEYGVGVESGQPYITISIRQR